MGLVCGGVTRAGEGIGPKVLPFHTSPEMKKAQVSPIIGLEGSVSGVTTTCIGVPTLREQSVKGRRRLVKSW